MKIIAGEYKGRLIEMPDGIRPTADKVRQALFETLKTRMEGASFLDLYCGSGAIGIEAISRGAKNSVFVDNNFNSIAILKKNLKRLNVDSSLYDIYNIDCLKGLGIFERQGLRFDIIFLDPPYYKNLAKNTLIELANCDILPNYAIIIAEVHKKESLPEEIGLLKKIRTSKYGDTILEFYTFAAKETSNK